MLRTLLLSTALLIPAAPALAQMQDHSAMHGEHHPGRITLSATGEVRAAPDMATVSAGVVAEAPTAAEALRANNRQMNGVFDALARAGIERADIQTSNLSINPVWSNFEGNRERRITGYQATNTVTARVDDLDTLGQTIDALVGSGANQIQGVNFMLEDRDAAMREARLEAVAELRELADLYAGALGVELGRIIEFSESSGGGYQPPVMYAARNMAMDESTPIAGGEVGISVSVTASFAIVD
ncbi:SIMPL domain-containing protein [Hyphobacterium marinum]|uniref:SIMPL domain-containing protein n=1 Tax=Hyphobacterium marinum TaxID=3116574 RepID=A0ABU7LX27_9PROT|nr:SIMPL domain-containing protein [Hyphobacterium sp. Y6023]MEE2566096.1 SIMPL domain-containing protein [Hyphobacterium sp. Y6023]